MRPDRAGKLEKGIVLRSPFVLFGGKNINPTRLIALGFGGIILLGALLLHLPFSSQSGERTSLLICLFTATSATCVTGLVQVDTVLHWSPFGQGVILLLLQIGGLGFVSLMTLASLALRRRIGLSQRLVMASALNLANTAGVVRVVRHALMGTFFLEGLGALLLSFRFIPLFGWGKGAWFSLFHSISAFCNGGFDLMGGYTGPYSSLAGFASDPLVLGVIMTLIVTGGLGFFVWEDLLAHRRWKKLSLYTKLVLAITGGLILLGWLSFLALEWSNPGTLGAMTTGEKVLNALFQSVTLRTAGYSVLNQGALGDSAGVLSILLMLVGGSSGSTAGGIKTVTAGVLLVALWESLRGKEQVVLRGRTIPQRRVLDAMTLCLAVVILFVAGAMALSLLDGLPFLTAAYEVASAIGTVGLSMGATPSLSPASSLLVILLMYLGRVGILSFSVAFLTRRADSGLRYPTADMMIG